MRIATLYDPTLPNSQYRCVIPLRALAERGHRILWPDPHRPFEHLLRCDLVHLHRQYGPRTARAIPRLLSAGVAVAYDNDDDLAAIPPESPGYPTWRQHGREAFTQTLEIARRVTLVTTPSRVLAGRYREAGAQHVEVIENHLPPEFVAQRPREHPGVVVGWIAGLTHAADAARLGLAPVLERLLAGHADLRVATIGLDLELGSDRYHNLDRIPFARLVHAAAAFDVGIAPLADIPFNRSRSDVKLKEYAALGVPWLASPVGPYRTYGPEQGGELVADGDWERALGRLVENRRTRRRLGRAGLRWARTQTIEHAAGHWESAFAAAVERVRHGAGAAAAARDPSP